MTMKIIEDKIYLKSAADIRPFFEDDYLDYFDCGQGYSQDEATAYVKIGTKHFEVTLRAEVVSQKQDRGDRLYWVESLESVEYCEVDVSDINKERRKQLEHKIEETRKAYNAAVEELDAFLGGEG